MCNALLHAVFRHAVLGMTLGLPHLHQGPPINIHVSHVIRPRPVEGPVLQAQQWIMSTLGVLQVATALQNAGAAAVTIHGRTMEQRYKRAADWGLVQQAAHQLTVPIIGNGDVLTFYEVNILVILTVLQQ